MNWEPFIRDFEFYLKIERGMAANTIANYLLDIQKLHQYLQHHNINTSPVTIASETLQQFIYDCSKTTNPRTQARLISGLKSFFAYLIFENYRNDNPLELIEAPRLGRKLPDTLSLSEIDQLLFAIDLSTPEGERNRAIIETLYSCGMRVSEVIGLKISDLYFQEGFVKITGKGNKQRFVPINELAKKYITQYQHETRAHLKIQKGHEDILFLNRRGRQLTRAMIFTIIKKLADKIKLNKIISPHTFRHSFATHLLQNGADLRSIQLMLGHESITTTEIYMHLDRAYLSQILTNFHPRSNERKTQ